MNELQSIGLPGMGRMGMPGMAAMGESPVVPDMAQTGMGLDEETVMLLQQLAIQDPGAYQQMMAEIGLPPEMFLPAGGVVQGGQPVGVPNMNDQRSDMTWQSLLAGPAEGNVSPIVDKVVRQLGLYDNGSDMTTVGADPYNQGAQLDDSIMQLLGGGAY